MVQITKLAVFIFFMVISIIGEAYPSTDTAPGPDQQELAKLGVVFGQIKEFYVHDKKDKELFEDAIRGMLKGLDPHSTYLNEEEFKAFKSQAQGNFVGVGIEVTTEKGTVRVVSPLDGTPAEKAGVKAGDYIIAVNDEPVVDMPLTKIVKKIRGKPGSKVELTLVNKKDQKPRKLTLTRKKITIQSVKSKLLGDDYGYVRISQFQQDTDKKVKEAVKSLQKKTQGHLRGLILDLRNNPGGLLTSAVNVVDTFLDSRKLGDNRLITYTKGRLPQSHSYFKAKPGDLLHGRPVVVLINQGSASGSEIIAGALQDHKRAIVMGDNSFGKGSVQTLLPLNKKTAIKLTTALYYTPKGHSIQAKGIRPDILVEDLKVDQENEQALFFLNIREQNLEGHLKNASKEAKGKVNYKKQLDLASKDFQLHEALMVLKALALTNKTVGRDT